MHATVVSTLTSLPAVVSRLSCRLSVFFQGPGRLCFSPTYLVIAARLLPLRSFSAEIASLMSAW